MDSFFTSIFLTLSPLEQLARANDPERDDEMTDTHEAEIDFTPGNYYPGGHMNPPEYDPPEILHVWLSEENDVLNRLSDHEVDRLTDIASEFDGYEDGGPDYYEEDD